MLARIAGLGLAVLSLGLAADRQALSTAQRQLNVDSFEYIWKTIRDKHWDSKLGGLDWQGLHDKLRPRVERADTMDKARAAMTELIDRLKATHFGIVPAEVYQDMETPDSKASPDGTPGIEVRYLEGRALVTGVEKGSPAEARRVRPGWQISRIDGKDLRPVLRKIDESYQKSTLHDVVLARAVESRLRGRVGSAGRIDFLDGEDQSVGLELDRARPRGTLARLGYLPPMYFWVEARKARPNIAYVRFNLFFEPEALARTFEETLGSCRPCDGFVIDLRGNPGGLGVLSMGVAGWFIDKPDQRLGTLYLRDNTIKFVINPRLEPFRGPLAILVDGCSGSTSEIFAGGLKDLGRARIFGTRSAGAALPSVFEKLPNGDGFQYAIANYISEGGKPLEGLGVTPDVEMRPTRQQLLAGQDPVLEAALSWIETATKGERK